MEVYKIENLSFAYPGCEYDVLKGINFKVNEGEFITVCGRSGCGKTTLLRLLKSVFAPSGRKSGEIYFKGKQLENYSQREQTEQIGFVLQNPDNQIVTDKVWHEMAFGLESLGCSNEQIRSRVAEMASFFGIQNWFHKKVNELSGGQKQLLNLASVMVMRPSVLILDEPTSQLDPIAAREFIETLKRINLELGTTVILTEHRLEEAVSVSDRVAVMDNGQIIADGGIEEVATKLRNLNHVMYYAMPTPVRIYAAVEKGNCCPVSVRQGRQWLKDFSENHSIKPFTVYENMADKSENAVIELKDIYFRYEKDSPDVIKGLNMSVNKGEIFAVTGGNGSGKTTLLSLISGLNRPYRGKIYINGCQLEKIHNLYNGVLGVLPQQPLTLFVKKTVYLDLKDMLSDKKLPDAEKERIINQTAQLCRIEEKLQSHPNDLSGGEVQRAALAKLLLLSPQIILMDEPTKGMDVQFKREFASILFDLKKAGATVVVVSHDIEFCAEYADRCSLVFDGGVTSVGSARSFFTSNSFYTTAANRMAKLILPDAVLADDIITACGGKAEQAQTQKENGTVYSIETSVKEEKTDTQKKKITIKRLVMAVIFLISFIITMQLKKNITDTWGTSAVQILTIAEFACMLLCLIPKKEISISVVQQPSNERKLKKRTLAAVLFIIVLIPLTVFVGTFYLQNKKYYFTSLMIILQTIIPFLLVFEQRKPQTREIIIISVLCALAVAGRTAFVALPEFKPLVAVIIISGVCFGGETGFLVGSIAGFVSNFFFGQGPLTPWQMFALGIVGFLAGVLFSKGWLRKTKSSLCLFGGFTAFIIYGVIMNIASVVTWQDAPDLEMIVSSCIMGIPFDLVHMASTMFFMWFISEPMIEKLERVKEKYGLM